MELRNIKDQVVNNVYIVVKFRVWLTSKCFSPVLQVQAANHVSIIANKVYYKGVFY